jgi:hypothetical protein
LHERAENFFAERKIFVIADDDFDAKRVRAGADDFDGLRMTGFGDEENVAAIFERSDIVIASAAAVASSSIEALARSRPVSSLAIVWKFSSASSRPWEISA